MSESAIDAVQRKMSFWRLNAAYKRVFSSAEGQRVLKDLLRVGNYTKTIHVAEDQGRGTALLEGRRQVVIHILDHVGMSPLDADDLARRAEV